MSVILTINRAPTTLPLPAETFLLMALRNDCGLNGPKYGCGLGDCGACSVLIEGLLARACVLQLGDVEGRAVTTLEGPATDGRLYPVQAALVEMAGAQCGYCLNGMIVTTVAFLRTNPDPSDGAIKDVLRYNLFRCGVHLEILAVVRRPDSADPEQLEPFVIVRADGLVTAFNGHVDLGAGIRTALAQIVAEELDVAFNHVTMILGDTALTPDHGPTIASETIQISAVPLRRAVAQARR